MEGQWLHMQHMASDEAEQPPLVSIALTHTHIKVSGQTYALREGSVRFFCFLFLAHELELIFGVTLNTE